MNPVGCDKTGMEKLQYTGNIKIRNQGPAKQRSHEAHSDKSTNKPDQQ